MKRLVMNYIKDKPFLKGIILLPFGKSHIKFFDYIDKSKSRDNIFETYSIIHKKFSKKQIKFKQFDKECLKNISHVQDINTHNGMFEGFDALSLYTIIKKYKPKSYIEIGSGFSTEIAFFSKYENNLKTNITSIDPKPRQHIVNLTDGFINNKLQDIHFNIFFELKKNDVLLFDGTHHVFSGSDATVFFMEILPNLKDGVIVGIHDIFLPYDYPQNCGDSYYNEQYVLAQILMYSDYIEPIFPVYFYNKQGCIFWFKIKKGGEKNVK